MSAPQINRQAVGRKPYDPQDWAAAGSCRRDDVDPELFFHPEGETGKARQDRVVAAKAVCADCPVLATCLEYALARGEQYGVWGGTGEEERAELRRVERLRRRRVRVAS
ncbi:MAG: WhiB family transcriptional regulator [Cellulosimicrobium sp.]|nr:WhiB family transcriptional regulator [Cellulosimicrobium sp.]